MIIFNNSSTSPWMTTLTLTIIFFCLIISTFLNPTVFIYNKKKTSIAGLLFCIISATDFVTCIYYPIIILCYAATLDLEEMDQCNPQQIQSCVNLATTANIATGFLGMLIVSVTLLTTGFLAIVRSIQIGFPFYPLEKSRALIILISLITMQFAMWIYTVCSPYGEMWFRVENLAVIAKYEFGKVEKPKWFRDILRHIRVFPILLAQACAVVASTFSAFTLFKQRNHAKSRIASAFKVILTNIPSLIFALILGTPVYLLVTRIGFEEASEMEGWVTFWVANMVPIMSSVWNPVVIICLTPKSREYIRSIAGRIRQSLAV